MKDIIAHLLVLGQPKLAQHLKGDTQRFHQGLISPTFYEQVLRKKIPKVQKDSKDISVFLPFLDLSAEKLLVWRKDILLW